MKSNRRNFLKNSTIAGAAILTSNVLPGCSPNKTDSNLPVILESVNKSHSQRFNMSGYAAPPLPVVRVGIIGLGSRGSNTVRRLTHIEGVEIKALCDVREVVVKDAQKHLENLGRDKAKEFYGNEDIWKELTELDDIDVVYVTTPWEWHTPMAVYAMQNDKHVACEVPVCKTIDEAWQIVETSENTKKHCMMLENCCYDSFELLTLNMARQGLFGEIIHGEGAYIHNIVDKIFQKSVDEQVVDDAYTGLWRLKEHAKRNGNLYPTHGLGPICQIMNINRGDKMDYLTSMSSDCFTMRQIAENLSETDPFYTQYIDKKFRGNMNTSLVRTNKGRTIMIQHDIASPRPYTRLHVVSGTKGFAMKNPNDTELISFGHDGKLDDEAMSDLKEKYTPEIVKRAREYGKKVGTRIGIDLLMDWRFIDCLRNGLPLDMDVYDGVLWSSIGPLSEWSVANRSNSIDVPDFTNGSWKTNEFHNDISLERGGDTMYLELKKTETA